MGSDYGYVNARIRGMKSRLISPGFYDRLLTATSFDDVVGSLNTTAYGRELSEVMIKETGLKGFDEALRRNIMKCFAKVAHTVDEDGLRLMGILLGRWDVANVKAILRGKNLGATSDAILESLIPGAEIDEATLLELVNARDVRDCIDTMATLRVPYAFPLTGAFPDYAAKRSLAVLEIALDKYYYARAFEGVQGTDINSSMVKEMLGREVDAENIMTVLRIVKEDIDRREALVFFIAGGRELPVWRLAEIGGRRTIEDAVQSISETSYHDLIAESMPTYFETGSLTGLQRALEQHAVRRGLKMWKADPLTIAGVIAYIWAKTNEIVNLRVIARGKQVGIPVEKMREALVLA
jgi:V/A-type H+/Na+-transporting ATPase subunit C